MAVRFRHVKILLSLQKVFAQKIFLSKKIEIDKFFITNKTFFPRKTLMTIFFITEPNCAREVFPIEVCE